MIKFVLAFLLSITAYSRALDSTAINLSSGETVTIYHGHNTIKVLKKDRYYNKLKIYESGTFEKYLNKMKLCYESKILGFQVEVYLGQNQKSIKKFIFINLETGHKKEIALQNDTDLPETPYIWNNICGSIDPA